MDQDASGRKGIKMTDFQGAAIRQTFSKAIEPFIAFVINKQLESISSDEFTQDTAIEILAMPPRFGGARFFGPYGTDGETYGYYDLEFDENAQLLHSRLNIDADEAIETVSPYYPEESRYWS